MSFCNVTVIDQRTNPSYRQFMGSYIAKRLLTTIPVMFCVVTLVFFVLRMVPGDPVDFILGENALPEARASLVANFHFDEPILTQYIHYIKDLARGEFGRSYFSAKSVNNLIAERYLATLELAFTAIFWALLLSIPLGLLAAVRNGTPLDRVSLLLSLAGISVPTFYLGPVLALLFSIHLDWFPVSGNELPGAIVLPSLTLGLAMAALLMRLTRSSLLEVLHRDYIRTARAKGLHEFFVITKHALRSALIPIIAILGLQFGTLLGGAVITEKIFSWPGLGSLLLESISKRDYALVQGCILLISATYVAVNLLTDLIYTWVDPRMKLAE